MVKTTVLSVLPACFLIELMKKRIQSFYYAFKGIGDLVRSQANARIHVVAMVLVVAAGFYFRISATEWCLLALAIASVLAAEAFNTALEYLTDLVSPDYHPLAGKAKDVAAAAVLLTAMGAAAAGLIVFVPKVWGKLS